LKRAVQNSGFLWKIKKIKKEEKEEKKEDNKNNVLDKKIIKDLKEKSYL